MALDVRLDCHLVNVLVQLEVRVDDTAYPLGEHQQGAFKYPM